MRSLLAETSGASTGNVALEDPNDIVARRIIVKGNVQGGYYRSCVLNEVGGRRAAANSGRYCDGKYANMYLKFVLCIGGAIPKINWNHDTS